MIEFPGEPVRTRGTTSDAGTKTHSETTSYEELASRIGLSPREYEIVRQVAHDRSNKQIAAILGISVWTVSTHLRRVFAKLDVHTRAAMVARVVGRI